MGSFAEQAEKTKIRLQDRQKIMEETFKEICIFVGEKLPPKTKSDELFGLLSRFIAAWKGSVKSYKEKSIRKDKSAAKDAEKEAKSAMKTKLKNDNGSSSSGVMKAKKMSPR